MLLPADYAASYANLATWVWDPDANEWGVRAAPIVNYLQNEKGQQSVRAQAAYAQLTRKLPAATGIPDVNTRKTFNFNEYDYINHSIKRCFLGKACPWEIQETLQLASEVGLVTGANVGDYCRTSLGVDCGGFVANYWGEACPHMTAVSPLGWDGILVRFFWTNGVFSDAIARRRVDGESVRPGDAAIFFKDIVNNNPDQKKERDSHGQLIEGTGSEAFHIGVVNAVGYSGGFTKLQIAQSAGGAVTSLGGNGVGVEDKTIVGSGKSGKKHDGWVYCQTGSNEWIYFVAPPIGWARNRRIISGRCERASDGQAPGRLPSALTAGPGCV